MTQNYVFPPASVPSVAIAGDTRHFPVRRIFCVGRNYAAHAAEMGHEVDREAPFYFTKSGVALCQSGSTIAYPAGTEDCHYEMEFVVALGAGGVNVSVGSALSLVFGYACGIDLTRRDLQAAAKEKRRPWDLGKDFDNAAIMAPITPVESFGEIGMQDIALTHNGSCVQSAKLHEMVWSVPEIIADLSCFYRLEPGDLIYTGTPAGVGPIAAGSTLEGRIDGLEPVTITIEAPV